MKKIIFLYKEFLRLGFSGVKSSALQKFSHWRKRRYFLLNAKRYPLSPKKGITILADMTLPTSLSKVMRDFSFALQKIGVPFQVFDLNPQKNVITKEISDIITPIKDFRILKYTHVIEMFDSPCPEYLPIKRARIVFWEFTTGLLKCYPRIGDVETIVAMSDFNYEVFKKNLSSKNDIRKILYPFFFHEDDIPCRAEVRERYGIPKDAFAVFFNFDFRSSFSRKNPDGALRAFAKAFSGNKDAYMIFKTNGAKACPELLNKLKREIEKLSGEKQTIIISDFIPQKDVYGLTNACDVYLSLHRGGGFGLGVAEAMSLAKPVVVTDYSSTTEFCNPKTSILIPYELISVKEELIDHPAYAGVSEWAEPNIEIAATALRMLYDNPERRVQIGLAAKEFIENYFSIEHFKETILNFLDA